MIFTLTVLLLDCALELFRVGSSLAFSVLASRLTVPRNILTKRATHHLSDALTQFAILQGATFVYIIWKEERAIKYLVRSSNRKRIRIDRAVHRLISSCCGPLIEEPGIGLTEMGRLHVTRRITRIASIVGPRGGTCFMILWSLGSTMSF